MNRLVLQVSHLNPTFRRIRRRRGSYTGYRLYNYQHYTPAFLKGKYSNKQT